MEAMFCPAFVNFPVMLKDSIGCIAKIRKAKGEASSFAFRTLI